jgi:hypothetical protein
MQKLMTLTAVDLKSVSRYTRQRSFLAYIHRVATFTRKLGNREKSGKQKMIREKSGINQKVRERTGKIAFAVRNLTPTVTTCSM